MEAEQAASPPLILITEPTRLDPVLDEVRRGRWTIRRGLAPSERAWRLDGLRLVCVGDVSGPDDAAAAVLAAARGAGVVVTVNADTQTLERLVVDLSRIGNVVIVRGSDRAMPELSREDRRILELLAGGASLDEVGGALNYSRRTVERRLAGIRDALGASTTAEAIASFRRG